MTDKELLAKLDWSLHCLREAVKDATTARSLLDDGQISQAETLVGFATSELAEAAHDLDLAYAELGLRVEP